jgi:hypothetical protein
LKEGSLLHFLLHSFFSNFLLLLLLTFSRQSRHTFVYFWPSPGASKRVKVAHELQKPEKDRMEVDENDNQIPYHIVIGEDVAPHLVGNIDQWRTPEGLVEPKEGDGKIGGESTFEIGNAEKDNDIKRLSTNY